MIFKAVRLGLKVVGKAALAALQVLNSGKVKLPRSTRAIGVPYIHSVRGATIELGRNVTLLSSNLFYHGQLIGPVKLLADKAGAVIKVGENSRLNGACVHAWKSVTIGKNCLIAANVQILDANGHELCMSHPELRLTTPDKPAPVVIGDNVWIGLNAIILPGTQLGDGCVVAAGSVVKGKFAARTVLGGVPAKVIRLSDYVGAGTRPA